VDERGCWVIAYATFFDFNRAVIKRQFLPYIRQAAQVLVNSPDIKVALIGHTDAIGTEAFNYDLGLRRALAVQNELIRQGVSSNRLGILSQGETAPIATNQTAAGRAKNRRVEIHVAQPGALDGYTPGDPDISEPLVDE
jgi:outer membrane protein OmpA-like peptidoglycan-associated protein